MAEPIFIYRLDDDAPVRLAAKELARALRAMTGLPTVVRAAKHFNPSRSSIYIGMPKHFRRKIGDAACPESRWDDGLLLRSVGKALIVTGANPRSVLFAAYRWLEALGARWVRPGKEGEYLPAIERPKLDGWLIAEAAANRHRGICIEGACSLEHVLALVEWMPKLRMNAYMLQFRAAAAFWRRWYERGDLGVAHPHLLSLEECAALDEQVIEGLRERGLLFHRVGHGWTCEAVGNHGSGWDVDEPAPAEIRPLLAEVNGVRDWADGIPINTELCYSNPEARARFIAEVLNYAQAHPEVDVLHIWASDGTNNHCECANCAPLEPSDWYITLLNELSPKLAAVAPHMRLIALCYSNTMWPPYKVAPSGIGDNLIFMFAPIARCYAHSILDKRCAAKPVLAPWGRNQVARPRANTDYAAMLRAWQQYLPKGTDAFVFDYHFWWSVAKDLLSTDFVGMLQDDVRQFHDAGVNGMLACQTQRNSFPTGLPQVAMAAYLWSDSATADAVEAEYLAAAFGPDAALAREVLHAFAEATGACGHGNTYWLNLPKRRVRTVRRVLRTVLPGVRQALAAAAHPVWKRSLKLLLFFVQYQQKLWRAFAARANDNPEAPLFIQDTIAFLARAEKQLHPWMDTSYYIRILRDELLPGWAEEDAKNIVNA